MGQYVKDLDFLTQLIGTGGLQFEDALGFYMQAREDKEARQTERQDNLSTLINAGLQAAPTSTGQQLGAQLNALADALRVPDRMVGKATEALSPLYPYGANAPSMLATMWDAEDEGLVQQAVQVYMDAGSAWSDNPEYIKKAVIRDFKDQTGNDAVFAQIRPQLEAAINRWLGPGDVSPEEYLGLNQNESSSSGSGGGGLSGLIGDIQDWGGNLRSMNWSDLNPGNLIGGGIDSDIVKKILAAAGTPGYP